MITLHPENKRASTPALTEDNFGCIAGVAVREIAPGAGVDTSSHAGFEKLTYLVNGILDHRDERGQRLLLLGGEVQVVGAGVEHSECNASHSEPLYLVQAWIRAAVPEQAQDHYEQKYFPDDAKLDRLCLVASSDGRDGSLVVSQDANVYAGVLRQEDSVVYQRRKDRRVWLQCARGQLIANKSALASADAAVIDGDEDCNLRLQSPNETEFLLFDIPA